MGNDDGNLVHRRTGAAAAALQVLGAMTFMTIKGEDRTIAGTLSRAAERVGTPTLISFANGRTMAAAELLQESRYAGGALWELGVRKSDRVAIFSSNRVEFLWAFFGIASIGAVSVPVNVDLKGPILDYIVKDIDPVAIVVEWQFIETVRQCKKSTAAQWKILVICEGALTEVMGRDEFDFGAAVGAKAEAGWSPASYIELASILYTSGTTGPSKGIMFSNNMAVSFAEQVNEYVGDSPSDVLYNPLPLYHANTLLAFMLRGLRTGATICIGKRFSASNYWREVTECGATVISLMGSMVPILWAQPPSEFDRSHKVRTAIGVPAPTTLFTPFADRFNITWSSLYGMSDIGLPIGTPLDGGGRPGLCGISHPLWESMVVDENDERVPDGQAGELVTRPRRQNTMQLGYWRKPEETCAAWRNLWFHTGDILIREADGWYRFVDRKKDAIRRSGENISSFEVELVLLQLPDIVDVAVYAVPSDLSEDEVMAAVVLAEGSSCTAQDIGAFAAAELPYYAVPRYIDIRPELPRTRTAKVRKDVLRKEGVTRRTWDYGPRNRKAVDRAGASGRTEAV
jgi:carnitine-CoA ligase